MDDIRRYELWLGFVAGIRPARHKAFIEKYGSAEEVYKAARDGKLECTVFGDDELIPMMKDKANEGYIDRCIKNLESKGIRMIMMEDAEYPALLKEIHTPRRCSL